MTKEEFKRRWEKDERGDGISFNDIAKCAEEWGLFAFPRMMQMDQVRYAVLRAAGTVDAEDFKPEEFCAR